MSATQEMPYFIKPSINLDNDKKRGAYEQALLGIDANLMGESKDRKSVV